MTDEHLERRLLRDRLYAGRREVENLNASRSVPPSIMLGQVVDGGAMPTATGRYFLVHPGRAGGAPTEGASYTTNWDTARKVPVLVVGSRVPQAGDVLQCWIVSGGRWSAESRRKAPCGWEFRVQGCGSLLNNMLVTLSQSGSEIAASTTSGRVTVVTRIAPGSGYTDGVGYPLGFSGGGATTQATGRFDVVAGRVTNLIVTSGGAGYTSPPTVSFPGAGAGSGASASSTVTPSCWFDVPAGTYDVTITPPVGAPYAAYSAALVHSCGQTTAVSLEMDSSHVCRSACGPCVIYPRVITVTFTFAPGYIGYPYGDDILTYDPVTRYWIGATTFVDEVGDTFHYRLQCLFTPPTGYMGLQREYDTIFKIAAIGNSAGSASTCEPFDIVGGNNQFDGTWRLMG